MEERIEKTKQSRKLLAIPPVAITIVFLLIQLLLVYRLFTKYLGYIKIAAPIWILILFIGIIYVSNSNTEANIQISWIILMTVMPIFGVLMYIFLHLSPDRKKVKKELKYRRTLASRHLVQEEEVLEKLKETSPKTEKLSRYLIGRGYPVYQDTEVTYYGQGEELFQAMFEEMEKAEKFIFLEFFTIMKGQLLDRTYQILEEKVRQGVEVKFLYDGTNAFNVDKDLENKFKEAGIEFQEFSPINPVLSPIHNNRDHRKILVIDNKVAFTGGVNIADEYANIVEKHGHWKDSGIRLKGRAVRSMTAIFLELWDLKNPHDNYEKYMSLEEYEENSAFVQPFGENPHDEEAVGESVYLDIINNANDHVYISTPYITISRMMKRCLILAAQKGVKVKLLVPHIGDHYGVPQMASRTYYRELTLGGVEIYEYLPGFVHSKVLVADGEISIVGTINMDYRSFYLHYEDAVLVYGKEFTGKVTQDIEKEISRSRLMTLAEYKKISLFKRIMGRIVRIFAPLM